jgi:hypothetical protein
MWGTYQSVFALCAYLRAEAVVMRKCGGDLPPEPCGSAFYSAAAERCAADSDVASHFQLFALSSLPRLKSSVWREE